MRHPPLLSQLLSLLSLLLLGGNADIVRLLLENASRLPQDFKTKEGWSSNLLQVRRADLHACRTAAQLSS